MQHACCREHCTGRAAESSFNSKCVFCRAVEHLALRHVWDCLGEVLQLALHVMKKLYKKNSQVKRSKSAGKANNTHVLTSATACPQGHTPSACSSVAIYRDWAATESLRCIACGCAGCLSYTIAAPWQGTIRSWQVTIAACRSAHMHHGYVWHMIQQLFQTMAKWNARKFQCNGNSATAAILLF
jgi:hypothetical protein